MGRELARAAEALLADMTDDPLDPALAAQVASVQALLALYWEFAVPGRWRAVPALAVAECHSPSTGTAGDVVDTDEFEISVVVTRRPGAYRIEVIGVVDQPGTVGLRRALDAAVAAPDIRVEVDLSGVTLFCGAAVAALMETREASGGRLVLVAAAPIVRKVLSLVGLAEAFPMATAPDGTAV